jgi:hypothetical protein
MTVPLDHARLLKIFELTASPSEHEASVAFSKARALAAESGLSLPAALRQAITVQRNDEIDLQRFAQVDAAAFARGRAEGLKQAGKEAKDASNAAPAAPKTHRDFVQCVMADFAFRLTARERAFADDFLLGGYRTATQSQLDTWLRPISRKVGVPLP